MLKISHVAFPHEFSALWKVSVHSVCFPKKITTQEKKWSDIKVAKHSFRTRFWWCNSARAQGLQKQTCRQ